MKPFGLRLENFGGDPGAGETARKLVEAAAKARGEGHAAGYAEGLAAADATAAAEDRRAVARLRESVADLELAQASAREEIVATLGPVVAALVRAVAPALAARGLDEGVAQAVVARLEAAPRARLALRCAPDRAEGLALRFGDMVELHADPTLTGAEARLEWDGGGAEYDAEACVRAALGAVEAFFGETDERIGDVG